MTAPSDKEAGLTLEEAHALLEYDPDTGAFYWRLKASPFVTAGAKAGTRRRDGYIRIRIQGREFAAHRLAWFMVHGEWPHPEVDHRNRDKTDNRLDNLRVVTSSGNKLNRDDAILAGYGKGYSFHAKSGKWQAQCRWDRRMVYLGLHETEEQAREAVMAYLERSGR